jgi:hypothetical protein
MSEFRPSAPSAETVFLRTYSRRKKNGERENFEEAMTRTVDDIVEIGKLSEEKAALVKEQALAQHAFPSGRAFWVAGTPWSKKQENFSGYYNCTSTHISDLESFGLLVDLAMQGSGTGAVLEEDIVASLPPVKSKLNIIRVIPVGEKGGDADTQTIRDGDLVWLKVGDSRQGWVSAYMTLIRFACFSDRDIDLIVGLENIRPAGKKLKGFGGTANPVKLESMFYKVADLLNGAVGRQLTPIEACLLIDEAATCVVAGNIRRSAGMRQFSQSDEEAATAKLGLYSQDENGNWRVDPKKEALRMANHTRCYHTKPTYEEVENAVRLQFNSGEGAIQYVPEAIARANADLLFSFARKKQFLNLYTHQGRMEAKEYLRHLAKHDKAEIDEREFDHRMSRYGLNPCLTGDTRILTVHQGAKSFEELVEAGEDVLVWCVNKETNEAAVRMMRNPRVTGYNQPVLEIEFDSGLKVRATHNHNFFTLQRNKVQAKDLKVGQSVSAFAIHQHRDGHLRITRNNKQADAVRQQFCHRVIAEYYGIEGEVIHHIDGDPTNNAPQNLKATTHLDHNREHYANRCRRGFYHGTPGPAAMEHIANHKVVAIRDAGTATVYNGTVDEHHNYVVVDPSSVGQSFVSGILSANCGEIIGRDFHCNLAEVHLNTLDPNDKKAQYDAFYAAGLQVAALLQHKFFHERYQYSREIDPIVGVSFTGLFDFMVHAAGSEWIRWMMEGRPSAGRAGKMFNQLEMNYLSHWRQAAREAVQDYCKEHGLRCPNRITTVQPAGTKSLLTGASSGWHPPKAQRFIRRITLGKADPLVPALIEYGYNVIPAQSARDDEGNLLDDITDKRVHEVLVEIPTEVSWANLPGCDQFDLSKLPVEAQWGLYMNVQNFYTEHNTSATIELREHEIPVLSKLISENIRKDGGYISAALLARFDANETFPRLPFEPISKEEYDRQILPRQIVAETDDRSLLDILKKFDSSKWSIESVAGCTSEACIAKAESDERDKGL